MGYMLAGTLAISAGLLAAPSLASAEPAPFGHACKAQDGVRFCPTETLAQRVPSFDGVPLDVDVTLPASGERPFPDDRDAARMGWKQDEFESSTPQATATRPSTTTTSTTPSTATRSLNYSRARLG